MSQQQIRILEQARPAASELDRLIFQMETTLGKAHTVSPFTQLYAQYGLSTQNNVSAPPEAEEKKQAAPKKEKVAKGKQAPADQAATAGGEPTVDKPAAGKKGGGKKQEGGKKGGGRQPAAAAATGPELSEEHKVFSQCDIRVGKIVECTAHPESEKLYIEKIDLGEGDGKIRTIVSGLQPHVTLEEMLADKIIVFANMKPRKLAGIMSEGMVLCAGNADRTTIELMRPSNDTPVGERVTLDGNPFGDEGLTQEAQPILNPKRKIEPKFLEKLTTDGDKQGLFDGAKLMTKAGPVVSKSIANGSIS